MDWIAIIYVVALAAVVAVVPVTLVRRWLQERSAQGLDAFKTVNAPAFRQLKAQSVQLTWLSYEMEGTRTCARVSIAHAARLPYVVLFSGGKVSCYDKKGYEEWTGQGGDPRCVPLPAQQLCDLGLLQRLQSVEGLDKVSGIITIEPGRIVAFEEGDRLAPAHAALLTQVMLKLAEEAEKPAFTLPTPKQSPAVP